MIRQADRKLNTTPMYCIVLGNLKEMTPSRNVWNITEVSIKASDEPALPLATTISVMNEITRFTTPPKLPISKSYNVNFSPFNE